MKKLLLVLAAMFLGVSMLSAVPVCTLPLTITLSTAQTPVWTPLCDLGAQLKVSFAAVPNPALQTPVLTDYFVSTDPADPIGTKVLQFNPALGGADIQDLILMGRVMTADGGAWIRQVTLAQTATPGVVTNEVLCAAAPVGVICNNPMGGTLQVNGSGRSTYVLPQPVAGLWFVKDVFAPANQSVSILQQRYTVPEPMSFLLIGSGLLGLGILRRRAVKR